MQFNRRQLFRRGSAASRSPSPTRLYEVTVKKIANPGKAASHQPLGRMSRALERMDPQLATEGGTPNPRKLKVDSMRIAEATPNVAATRTGARVFGSTCRKMVRQSDAPKALAATTYSRDFVFNTSPRVRRATVGQLVMPITTMTLKMLCGRKVTTVMIRKNVGIVSMISISRETTMSTTPP